MLGLYKTDCTLPIYGGLLVQGTGRKVDNPGWGGVFWEFEIVNPYQRIKLERQAPEGRILVRPNRVFGA